MTTLNPRIITLGTAGGPRWWTGPNAGRRAGISTAVVVGDAVYLVDAGSGVGRQLMLAGLSVADLRGIFLTHLHSDHTVDLASLALFGMFSLTPGQTPITILGPGDRGILPPVSPLATKTPRPLNPASPTPGTAEMFDLMLRAHATDLNDRILDALRPSPQVHFTARDIAIPSRTGYHPNENPTPAGMAPFEIYRDDLVTVTATLVQHPPIAPAFAFRFDTVEGSVTISGDTAPCENLTRLAAGSDLLLHEAIDFDWVERSYGGLDDDAARASISHHRRSHTSPADAIDIAHRAGVPTLALHHLVPGTTPDAVWRSHAPGFDGTFLIPDDLDTIPFSTAAVPAAASIDEDEMAVAS
ncbi:MBL fold metallo-hydrolase [Microbacterium hominis]|uniref:MBL fold metallo-hydrolase n=1 Tax=Microbacterium hominis TaxID=162426 RepID=A0A7D4PUZ7_9MICO|nr:MBL fold metallo-hydrolase [Microbacterium hominis]QKJ20113.1 MBL fold metallo-hydrolase [Microbacterium hominis]